MSTPYQRHRHYFQQYHTRYWQTHPQYRNRQNQLRRERYSRNKQAEVQRTKKYISEIYRNWFGETQKTTFSKATASLAEKVAVEKILPKEGFTSVLWTASLDSVRGEEVRPSNFGMFDAFALRHGKRCAIQITTSPFKQIRNRAAISLLLKFFELELCVCTVNPDLKHYVLSFYDADHVPHTVIMTPRRVKERKPI